LALQTKPGDLVLSHDSTQVYDVFKFRRFRLNVIGFLKLPLGVSEKALRDVIKGCSANLLANYVARAEYAVTKSGAPVHVPSGQTSRVD
jgi:hypothetical protein